MGALAHKFRAKIYRKCSYIEKVGEERGRRMGWQKRLRGGGGLKPRMTSSHKQSSNKGGRLGQENNLPKRGVLHRGKKHGFSDWSWTSGVVFWEIKRTILHGVKSFGGDVRLSNDRWLANQYCAEGGWRQGNGMASTMSGSLTQKKKKEKWKVALGVAKGWSQVRL